jgi:hypothetical protein
MAPALGILKALHFFMMEAALRIDPLILSACDLFFFTVK